MNILELTLDNVKEYVDKGYTLHSTWTVEYADRVVEVPEGRYKDVIDVERALGKPYDKMKETEECASWLVWHRLKRHQDENERPTTTFEVWLDTIESPNLKVTVDLDENIPLAKKRRKTAGR